MQVNRTMEDCLVLMNSSEFDLETKDQKLINSLAAQVNKNIGLTDRQLNLARKKLDEYQNQLVELNVDVNEAKQNLELPLRNLDRSRWIRIEDSDDGAKIAVRFRFAKKLINAIEQVKKIIPKEQRAYDSQTKTYTVDYNELNLYTVVNAFWNYQFELDTTVQSIYRSLLQLVPEDIIPGVYDNSIRNLPKLAVEHLEQEVGVLSNENLVLYKDRSLKYGLHHFDNSQLHESLNNVSYLAARIANRLTPGVSIENSSFTIESIMLALQELNRLPCLVVLPDETKDQLLINTHTSLKKQVLPRDVSVMFRMENTLQGAEFNNWLKQEKINNRLDSTKKIVYTVDTRIPKPVLQSDWQPRCVISFAQSSLLVSMRKILNFYADQDLIIHYEDSNSGVFKGKNFNMEKIK